MIEVEKSFSLTKEQENNLIKGAEFLGEKRLTDIYYDDLSYALTTKDIWLRKRGRSFELKLPINKLNKERISDQYEELDTDQDILEYFNADSSKVLEDFLLSQNYAPFCTIITTRKKYIKEGFNIDLDVTDFGYINAEIELIVSGKLKIEEATNNIIRFAKKNNIVSDIRIWGKVIEYIRRNNLKHFQALLDSKVIV